MDKTKKKAQSTEPKEPKKTKKTTEKEPSDAAAKNEQVLNLGDGVFNKNNVRIAEWNVAGLRAVIKKDEFFSYLKEQDYDIVSFNETKIQDSHIGQLGIEKQFENYNMYWNCSKPPKAGYAGTAIFSKVKPISVKYGLGIDKHDSEGRLITLEFQKFYFLVCYVPNAGRKLERLDYRVKEWDVDFFQYLKSLKEKKTVILAGDLNVAHNVIDIYDPKNHDKAAGFTKEERNSFSRLLNEYGFVDSFRHLHPEEKKFSYFSYFGKAKESNRGWRLDYFVIDKESIKAVNESQIDSQVNASDHTPIRLEIDLSKL